MCTVSITQQFPESREQFLADTITSLYQARKKNKAELAAYMYEMRELLAKTGREGQFTTFLRGIGLARTTAYRWIEQHEVAVGIKAKRTEPVRFNEQLSAEAREMLEDAIDEANEDGVNDTEDGSGDDDDGTEPDGAGDDDASDDEAPHDKNLGLRYPEVQHALISDRLNALAKVYQTSRATVIFNLVEEAYSKLGVQ
jgi:hypothetical protein